MVLLGMHWNKKSYRMKKSKSFEDLNIKTNDSSDEIILNEFIKNINSHIDFLRTASYFLRLFLQKSLSQKSQKKI